MSGPGTRKRILKYLLKKNPSEFTAADIAKELNLTSRAVGYHLRQIEEVQIKNRRKYAHTESGNRYSLVKGAP
jgi:DNA-binding MarR family transcriptional regulator